MQALYAIEGHQLERKKLRGSFLSQFPGDQDALTQRLQDTKARIPEVAAAAPAAGTQQPDQAAELTALMARESQNLPADGYLSETSVAASHFSAAAASQEGSAAMQTGPPKAASRTYETQSPFQQERMDMHSVQRGVEALGLRPRAVPILPRPQGSLNIAAPAFRPGGPSQGTPAQVASLGMGLASAGSQASLSSADGLAASMSGQPGQLGAAGRAMSGRSDVSSLQRASSAAGDAPPHASTLALPGALPCALLCWLPTRNVA